MERLAVPFLALALLTAAPAGAQTDPVDEYVTAQMEIGNIPGMSLVVLRDGEIVKVAAYGVADRSLGTPVTPETIFRIGSTSKQFIAAGIMLLVQDGKLGVDDPVARYIEDVPDAWRGITVRHLLTHTAGLVRNPPGWDPFVVEPDIETIRRAYDRPLEFVPGERAEYSNFGYFVLVEIISRASGRSWPKFFEERVFAPLDMESTRTTTQNGVVPNRARGYTDNNDLLDASDWLAVRPSGAFQSTVLDMARWEAALETNDILTEASRREMWTPVTLNDGSAAPWGFGWHVEELTDTGTGEVHRHVWHGGDQPGFQGEFHRYPDDGLTVILLMNLDDADALGIAINVAVRFYLRKQVP